VLVRLAAAAVVVVAALELVLIVVRPESGPLAIVDILTPHLAIAGLLAAPIALVGRRPPIAASVVLLIVVVASRFGGGWLSLPAPASADGSRPLAVATWNLQVRSRPAAETVALLGGATADVVALQELQPDVARAIELDIDLVARYPYRRLSPRSDVLGLGLLSRYPILGDTFRLDPAVQTVRLAVGDGAPIVVVNAHPLHGFIATASGVPIGFDVRERNRALDAIRSGIVDAAAGGPPVILLGDLNTTDTEPAFGRFVAGLRDVHAEVGEGPGWTWRPTRLEFLGFGLVRIDYVIVTPAVQPISIGETCPRVGDHCLVNATLAVPARAGAAATRSPSPEE
jgi:endonuclease/exonuclease/phosphatase (EEP) superfamily protein YafD